MSEKASEDYLRLIVGAAPRVLSMMDREEMSSTVGCCDRTFWAWKFVDFPRSRFQEALCFLGFLFAREDSGGDWYQNPKLARWIRNGFEFWESLQHRDGSFDEAYPMERSFAATAFTSFYVAECSSWLGEHASRVLGDGLENTLARAGAWLLVNEETHGFLSNHQAAGAAALYHAFLITGDGRFRAGSKRLVRRILDHQSSEGWYEEYGGADPGYQTHGCFYLARLWQLARWDEILESLARSTTFLAHFVHPDGSIGGEYASRNTQTYYPAAFEMLAEFDPSAAFIADRLRPSTTNASAAGLSAVDRYNLFPMLNNLVFAYAAVRNRCGVESRASEPGSEPGLSWFPEAGLARIRTDRLDTVVGTSKGGVIKAFDRRGQKLIYSDCGYLGRLSSGALISTQQQAGSAAIRVEPDRIIVKGGFYEVSRPTMTPFRFVAFRLASLILCRVPGSARWLKNVLVHVLIYRKRKLEIDFERVVEVHASGLRVRDSLRGSGDVEIERLIWSETFTTIHMGSARYFISNELRELSNRESVELDHRQLSTGITLERSFQVE